jgi:cell division protein FtsX
VFDVGRLFVSPALGVATVIAVGAMVRLTVMARRTVSFCV